MRLEDVLRISLSEGKYFGLNGDNRTFYAEKEKTVEDFITAKVGAQVYQIIDKVAHPYSFTVGDILSAEWDIKIVKDELSTKRCYAGIVSVHKLELDKLVDIIEKGNYGVVDSYQDDYTSGNVKVFCHSWLFDAISDGEPTPFYSLTFDEDSGALTAERIGVQ